MSVQGTVLLAPVLPQMAAEFAGTPVATLLGLRGTHEPEPRAALISGSEPGAGQSPQLVPRR